MDTFFDGEQYRPYVVVLAPLAKHDVTKVDVAAVMASLVVCCQVAEAPKLLLIGFDGSGRLLELIGGVNDDGVLVIWHGMRCRRSYLRLLPPRSTE